MSIHHPFSNADVSRISFLPPSPKGKQNPDPLVLSNVMKALKISGNAISRFEQNVIFNDWHIIKQNKHKTFYDQIGCDDVTQSPVGICIQKLITEYE